MSFLFLYEPLVAMQNDFEDFIKTFDLKFYNNFCDKTIWKDNPCPMSSFLEEAHTEQLSKIP